MVDGADVDYVGRRDLMLILAAEMSHPDINHMAWLQNRYDAEHTENIALRAENWRLILAKDALIRAAGKLTEQPPDAVPPDVNDLAPGHPLRLRKLIEALKPTPQWLCLIVAAHRYGCSYENMRLLAKHKKVISRRVDGAYFVLTASIDKRLRELCRTPNL